MFGILKINWKNTAENLIVFIIGGLVGAFISICSMIVINKQNYIQQERLMKQQILVQIEAVKKHSTNVSNDIDNNIDKNKKGVIAIDQQPKIDSEIIQTKAPIKKDSIINEAPSVKPKKKWLSFLKNNK